MTRTLCFRGLLLVLILALLTPPAFAAGPREPEGPSFRGVLSALWQALAELIPGSGAASETSASTSGDAHGTMDPNG